tara:strand:+ start:63 stop:485 length:423 start_codon:yes stop_codon:yes gene_type:complete
MDLEILPELWREIKTYLFHNIQTQGKHLKKDKYISHYNYVLLQLPRLHQPYLGSRILYRCTKKNLQYVKFLYCVPPPSTRCWLKTINGNKDFIIEYFNIPKDIALLSSPKKDICIREVYYKNIYYHSPKRLQNCSYEKLI